MKSSEKEFIKRITEAGLKLPTSSEIKGSNLNLANQSQFIKDLAKSLEKRELDQNSAKSFQMSLTIENYMDKELIEQFIPSDLLNANLFAGRNVSEYKWFPASDGIKSLLKDSLCNVDGDLVIQIGTSTSVHFKLLSWYKKTILVKLSDVTWSETELHLYYLISDGDKLTRLNGTSPAILEINVKAPIQLNIHNALDYLMFFCFFVRGDDGPFYIIESLEDAFLPRDKYLDSIIQRVSHQANEPTINENGDFVTRAVVYYSNALFEAQFVVKPNGMVEMLNDEPIAGNLSFKIHQPIKRTPKKNEEEN